MARYRHRLFLIVACSVLVLSYFNHPLIWWTDSVKTLSINFMRFRLVGEDMCNEDRRTDMTKTIIAFLDWLANANKKRVKLQTSGVWNDDHDDDNKFTYNGMQAFPVSNSVSHEIMQAASKIFIILSLNSTEQDVTVMRDKNSEWNRQTHLSRYGSKTRSPHLLKQSHSQVGPVLIQAQNADKQRGNELCVRNSRID
jgi:hypothetical protein